MKCCMKFMVILAAIVTSQWASVACAEIKQSSAYSCLSVLPNGDIGCLYEKDGYKQITLARFSLEWLQSEAGE